MRNLDEIYDYDGPKRPGLLSRVAAGLRSKANMIPGPAHRHHRVFGKKP